MKKLYTCRNPKCKKSFERYQSKVSTTTPFCSHDCHYEFYSRGNAPYGFRLEDGEVVHDPAEQKVLALIKGYREKGFSLHKISKTLADAGFKARNGKPFHHQAISRMNTAKITKASVENAAHGELRDRILAVLATSKNTMNTAQHIGKKLCLGTYEITSHLKQLESVGQTYKVFPQKGCCHWGLMKNFRCYNCGTTKNPSDREFKTCVKCERSQVDFQFKWACTPLLKSSGDECYFDVYRG